MSESNTVSETSPMTWRTSMPICIADWFSIGPETLRLPTEEWPFSFRSHRGDQAVGTLAALQAFATRIESKHATDTGILSFACTELMKLEARCWETEDYKECTWRDNHVHSFRALAGYDSGGDLVLDIDYILEWLIDQDDTYINAAPAFLRFHNATKLRIVIDYAEPTSALTPFSIGKTQRTEH